MGASIGRTHARVMPCPNDDESRVQISSSLKQKYYARYLTLHISIKLRFSKFTYDHTQNCKCSQKCKGDDVRSSPRAFSRSVFGNLNFFGYDRDFDNLRLFNSCTLF